MKGIALAAACALVIAATTAEADIVSPVAPMGALTMGGEWVATATNQTPTTVTGNPSTNNAPVQINDLTQNPSTTYFFNNSFTAPNGSLAGTTISDGGAPAEAIGFIDSYVFTVTTAEADSSVFSLKLGSALGLSNLTLRLYDYTSANSYVVGGTAPVSNSTLVDNWTASTNATSGGYVASTGTGNTPLTLAAGKYVLEVAGWESGSTSGSYSGQLNVTPVPLPAGLPLLFGGAGMLAGFARRRRRDLG